MTPKPEITLIPQRKMLHSIKATNDSAPKKRVCAYARVSTSKEEQTTSYAAQLSYYENFIKQNKDWEFVEVYADEAVTGTSIKNRAGFNRMIDDALSGKIDLILTKSVSRFARNTIDSLTAIRKLRDKNVYVIFEEQGINTADGQGELLITIMSCIAQEESRSISENVTWGQRKRMADGKISLPYGRFLGYEKGEDGLPKVVESEAKTVRLIFSLFLQGKTCGGIARSLTKQGALTPAGERKPWCSGTVQSILKNEKYKGDALLQKAFTTNFLTKRKKKNEGEIPQFYVKNSHPKIVDADVYDMAQLEFEKRKGGCRSGEHIFSSKIICGSCGGFFSPKTWHSNDKYRKTVWRCGHKYEKGTHCPTPHLSEDAIKCAFVETFNRVYDNKSVLADDYETILSVLTDTVDIDKHLIQCKSEQAQISQEIMLCVEENSHSALDQADYQQRYEALQKRYEAVRDQILTLENEKRERSLKRESIVKFVTEFERSGPLLEFDDAVWNAAVEKAVVDTSGKIMFTFRDGSEK